MTDLKTQHKILVVDDNQTGRYVKARILKQSGYSVLEAGDGKTALAMIESDNPALVLLDVKLPDMSGIEVCAEIKKTHPSIMVVQTSAAFTGKHDRASGLVGGADSYLIEPIEPEEVIATVASLLRLYSAEQELRTANEGLEGKIQQRTKELAEMNDRLLSEIKERIRAEEIIRHTQKLDLLGQLTGGIAHDFNNLLMVVLGNLESLKRQMAKGDRDEDRLNKTIENAMTGGRRAAALTQDLLTFARRQPLDPKPINSNQLLHNLSDIMKRSLGEQIAVDFKLEKNLWVAAVDRNQLENALLNLAVNARDAMPDGGKLTVETRNIKLGSAEASTLSIPDGEYVMFKVTDTGHGMSPDILEHAIEPFFTTKDVGQGTGLGLSQIYGFVTQSGGEITLESQVGKGTTVSLYLPRSSGTAISLDEVKHTGETPRGHGEKILVVEDDHDVRRQTTANLTELGYNVVAAENGPSALVALKDHLDTELMFTDVGLPGGMSGPELAEKAVHLSPKLKTLLTTGYGLNTVTASSPSIPDSKILRKPFTFYDLAMKLREVIGLTSEPSQKRILVVDDDALIRCSLVDMLEDMGFLTEEAGTGREAIEKAQSKAGSIDAAIVDMKLPDISGDAVATALRKSFPTLPIIIASGYYEKPVIDRLSALGHLAFLGKPYDGNQLTQTLGTLGIQV
jgi:CheY-like chemotaxis protein